MPWGLNEGRRPMNRTRIGIALIATVGLANSQTPVPRASQGFEAAAIKPTDPAYTGRSILMPPDDGRVTMRGWSLKELIRFAWGNGTGLHPGLVSGGPTWFDRDRYDIVAKSEGPRIPSQDERRRMMRILIEERFQLKHHSESRAMPVYALLVGKSGPKMKERKSDDGGAPFSLLLNGFRLPGRNASIAQLADILQSLIPLTDSERDSRPVLDKTGLAGKFDFDLIWAPDPGLSGGRGGAREPAKVPDLFIAVEEELGLKLEMQEAPMAVLVVDHAVKPTEN
jgi:uncharacterized protein (TIGR03435 family)